jgi:hypothetical protein
LPIRLPASLLAPLAFALACASVAAQQPADLALPDAPSFLLASNSLRSSPVPAPTQLDLDAPLFSTSQLQPAQQTSTEPQDRAHARDQDVPVDANGNPVPLQNIQPKRILGFMPNFRSVSAGAKPHPPGWGYNFHIATRQAFDYSSFIFLGLTTISAEGINSHPVLGKGADGFYAYLWRGLLDKTDGTYIGAWFLPSLLHEDTRYYAMGNRRSIPVRALYVMSRQVVTRTYSEHQTPNFAGLGGKVLTQLVSRQYYPTGATSFSVLATKFAYSAMRDMAFTSIREFYPDIAAHYIRKHREKVAAQSARDAAGQSTP